ncbi:hypothetical protein CVU75_01485 [Candidatus Dependentiae bacterium HGW-Dependentiae-1]|nr:MAG: hypothetical protein CVU75_01485 [Candidatus Dependentiae bacterium HGW-Dependentiae-1]
MKKILRLVLMTTAMLSAYQGYATLNPIMQKVMTPEALAEFKKDIEENKKLYDLVVVKDATLSKQLKDAMKMIIDTSNLFITIHNNQQSTPEERAYAKTILMETTLQKAQMPEVMATIEKVSILAPDPAQFVQNLYNDLKEMKKITDDAIAALPKLTATQARIILVEYANILPEPLRSTVRPLVQNLIQQKQPTRTGEAPQLVQEFKKAGHVALSIAAENLERELKNTADKK